MYSSWLDSVSDSFDVWFFVHQADEHFIQSTMDKLLKFLQEYDGHYIYPYETRRVFFGQAVDRPPQTLIETHFMVGCTYQTAVEFRKHISGLPNILWANMHLTGRGGGGGWIIYLLLPGEHLIASSGYDDPFHY